MDFSLLEEKDPAKIAAAVENSLRALLAKGPPKKASEQTVKLLAIEGSGVPPPGTRRDSDSDSEGDEPKEEELPPGPIDPKRCTVSGPGFSGGTAGVPSKLVITAKDSHGKRIREGGAYVVVYVEPGARAAHSERIDATLTDHKDGTYTAYYTVPSKGDFKLCIDINGQPLADSPFPVFFSAAAAAPALPAIPIPAPTPAPQPAPAAGPGEAAGADVGGAAGAVPVGAPGAVGMPQLPQGAAAFPALAAAFPNLGGPGMNLSLGQQAVQVGVKFPTDDEDKLSRMLLVGGISPFATAEQLRSVFGFCGTILSIELTGPANSYAFVEYGSSGEAAAALAMNGVQLLGQHMNVDNARAAKAAADAAPPPAPIMDPAAIPGLAMMGISAANPFLSAQMQQLQQFQMLQQQQAALAEQVVMMRAMQRAGGAPAAAALGSNDQQKSAAIAAAIALSKRLASGKGAEGEAAGADQAGKERRRSRSRSRSPAKERSKRRQSKSRSRSRDRRDRSRDRSRRERSKERSRRERSSRERRDHSRERRQARPRDSRRASSRERRAEREREVSRRDDRDRGDSRRDKEREKGGRRDRSKERGGGKHGSKRDKRDRSRDKEHRKRSRREEQKGAGEEQVAAAAGVEQRRPEEEEGAQQGPAAAAAETSSKSEGVPAGDELENMLNELDD